MKSFVSEFPKNRSVSMEYRQQRRVIGKTVEHNAALDDGVFGALTVNRPFGYELFEGVSAPIMNQDFVTLIKQSVLPLVAPIGPRL